MSLAREFRVLAPTAILGYGFPEISLNRGLALQPNLIAVDAGSIDPGPYYLGAGVSFTDVSGVRRDLRLLLQASRQQRIPLIIGTAGGAGAKPHVDWCLGIIEGLLTEMAWHCRVAVIYADMEAEKILAANRAGLLDAIDDAGIVDEGRVRRSNHIVAQMGVEPFQQAWEAGCDIILAGRAYDPAVFAALPMMEGFDAGLSLHMGKILECAAIAAEPGSGSDAALGILSSEHFTLVPLNDDRRFSSASVAAHSLYEKSDPVHLHGPGGMLDLDNVHFEQVDQQRVRVSGSRFVPSEKYRVKLEAACPSGYRSICLAGARDPVMIRSIEAIVADLRNRVQTFCQHESITGHLCVRLYGKNAVLGSREPQTETQATELGILLEGIAASQSMADSICSFARSTLLHLGFPGRLSTAGNLAFPFSPSDLPAGEIYEYALYHLMTLESPSIFPVEMRVY